MPRIRKLIAMAFALVPLVLVFAASAAQAEKRVALVVGNAGYQVGALATPANDAGLVARATRFSACAALATKTNASGINANAVAISLRIRGMTSPIENASARGRKAMTRLR